MTLKEKALRLVDVLPEEKLPDAERFLESLLGHDPLLIALANAPDDEPYTEEEQAADEAARERFHRGDSATHAEVGRRPRASAGNV